MDRNDRGSVVWWVIAVMGCALAMLSALGLVAHRSVRSAQAQAAADLSALAAVGVNEAAISGHTSESPERLAQHLGARNGWRVESVGAMSTTLGGRVWRVRVGDGEVRATAAARADRVHPTGAAAP